MDAQKALRASSPEVRAGRRAQRYHHLRRPELVQRPCSKPASPSTLWIRATAYPTDVKFGATLPPLPGTATGRYSRNHGDLACRTRDEAWNEAREEGAVLSVGQSLGKDWQSAFVIPKYLQEQYPDLDSVEDLKDDQYKALFATAETGGKGTLGVLRHRLVPARMSTRSKSRATASMTTCMWLIPGDGAALNADIYGAYERQEPWLGYQWGTNDPALKLDLVRLEEPAYSDQCWFTTQGLRLRGRHDPNRGESRPAWQRSGCHRHAEEVGLQHRHLQGSRQVAG